ncbi:P-loop containing nucleoside triphosphate hydrolase protein [Peziza echinospora]|nr:P-loop containing nucleoside triphosphate hydrolase protein [Peziza echinospora]
MAAMASRSTLGNAAETLPPSKPEPDVEYGSDNLHLYNDLVSSFSFGNISVQVQDKISNSEKLILDRIDGTVEAGDMVAIMGPSGSGKTTLLNVLAHRLLSNKGKIGGDIYINQAPTTLATIRRASRFVEQEDSLIGSLTARETLEFSAKLGLPRTVSKGERKRHIDNMLSSFGLTTQANTIVGTPIQKGLSGGEKRRLSVASQLITCPKILFLDEPTSGLDSVASYEVISYLREVAKRNRILVIISIHQPSTSTFNLFDTVFLLSKGRQCYGGRRTEISGYFQALGFPMPLHINPAEFLLDLVNVEFHKDRESATRHLHTISEGWADLNKRPFENRTFPVADSAAPGLVMPHLEARSQALIPFILLHRNFIKARRDVVVYGIRIAMYVGFAILCGTVFLRLKSEQEYIQTFINCIFFGSAFLSFMAVAYVPAFLEDRATYVKERANGLYGPGSFLVANFLIGAPFLFLISILYAVISYWLVNFRPTGEAFFMYTMWLYLDLLAAESLVVLISSIFPVFVISLALTAFTNGLWMAVSGFMVAPSQLNAFWKYWARYSDYQSYVFQGMMVNEFRAREFKCAERLGGGCDCMYPTDLVDQCLISGKVVLSQFGYNEEKTKLWVGILLCIVLGYRLLTWVVLVMKRA